VRHCLPPHRAIRLISPAAYTGLPRAPQLPGPQGTAQNPLTLIAVPL
jgi:hypothetical protein